MNVLRQVLKFLIPSAIRSRLRQFQNITYVLALNYVYDFQRYRQWSSFGHSLSELDKRQLEALITMEYHAIEKGLALSRPRPGFGVKRIEKIIELLDIYKDRFGTDELVQIAVNVMQAYDIYQMENNGIDQSLHDRITSAALQYKGKVLEERGGVRQVSRQEILANAQTDLSAFFMSRHSVRHFSCAEVDEGIIRQAISLAQKTPSVCNRQAWRVHVFSEPKQKQQILLHQNGNSGFGDQADKVLIVSMDLRAFTSVGERYQAWIDGGMFAMSLVYALHSLGLGTCCLNWSVSKDIDQRLRKEAQLQEFEIVIMLIAVGHLPEKFSVAQSPRRRIDDILIFHKAGS